MGILRFLFRLFSTEPKRGYTTSQPDEIWTPPKRVPPLQPLTSAGANKVASSLTLVESLRGRCYVVDGDTITIGKTNIRLSGIDAPEMDQPFGKNAKWALFNLCNGHEVRAEFTDHLSYERCVATCYLPDGRDLSAEMVKLGLALDWRKFSGGKYRHLEPDGVRRKLWRVDAKHKGQMPANKINC